MRVTRVKPKQRRRSPTVLERINPNAAGIDCGSAEHYVAVPNDRDQSPVRSFKTFTADLHRLAEWLATCSIKTVAMEATGVYWIPVFEILEARGFEVLLVNARHVKNVPGRKSVSGGKKPRKSDGSPGVVQMGSEARRGGVPSRRREAAAFRRGIR